MLSRYTQFTKGRKERYEKNDWEYRGKINWHSGVEKEGNSSVIPNADKTLVFPAVLFFIHLELILRMLLISY